MKFLLLLLLFPLISKAQNIVKNANTIIVKHTSFNEVATSLVDHGYFIDKKDSLFKTIITLPRNNFWKNQGSVTFYIRIKDSTAFITGKFNMAFWGNDYSPIENRGMKNSMYQQAFTHMNDFALSLKKETYYTITP